MAAGITPGEAGLILEPVQQVVDWASHSTKSELLGQTAINYQEYITLQSEGQGEQ